MARQNTHSIRIRDALTRVLPPDELEALAVEAKVVKRARKVPAHALFWTLVLGFGTGQQRTLAALRRAFELATEIRLAASSFYVRFTPALLGLMKAAAGRVMARVADTSGPLKGTLSGFRDLVIADATVIRLHDLLADAFPACRTNHTRAAVKLHTVLSVCGAGPRAVKLTSERVHDSKVLRLGRWLAGKLLLFDLAYFDYRLFARITDNGGCFVTRLKKSANPRIVGLHRQWRGRAVPLVGERIWDVADRLTRQTIDAEVEVRFSRRRYAGRQQRASQRLRLVGVLNPHTGDYHLYLTNIAPDRLTPEDIAQTYAARWLVELFFRELKGHYRAEDIPSSSRVIVETLLYSVILTVAVSHSLLAAVRAKLGALGSRVPEERWAAVFAAVARDLLVLVLGGARSTRALERAVSRILEHEAIDPNRRRARLRERVEARTQLRCMLSRVNTQ